MCADSPIAPPRRPTDLRDAVMRLVADLDQARLFQAAAYAAMAADVIFAPGGEPAQEDARTDIELEFELDEHGRVWMIREGDCYIIGRKNAVCAEMRRFLRAVILNGGACDMARF